MKRLACIILFLGVFTSLALGATPDAKREMKMTNPSITSRAISAGGCFWYMEPPFEKNPARYKFYRYNSGRDTYLRKIWGEQ